MLRSRRRRPMNERIGERFRPERRAEARRLSQPRDTILGRAGGLHSFCSWLNSALSARSAAASTCLSPCPARLAPYCRCDACGHIWHDEQKLPPRGVSLGRRKSEQVLTLAAPPWGRRARHSLCFPLATRTTKDPCLVESVAMKDQKWESEAEIAARLRSIAEELRQQRLAGSDPLSSRSERRPRGVPRPPKGRACLARSADAAGRRPMGQAVFANQLRRIRTVLPPSTRRRQPSGFRR